MGKTIDLLDESQPAQKVIWHLAWPAVLEQMLITLVQYVDTAMVGSLGFFATAAVAVSASTGWLVNGLLAAVAVGFSVPIGRLIGEKRHDDVKAVVRQGVKGIFIVGFVITAAVLCVAPFLPRLLGADPQIHSDAAAYLMILALSYIPNTAVNICSAIMRCSGDTRTPLFFNIATNVINVILNLLLIFPTRTVSVFGLGFILPGAGLGVAGAAIASSIAITFSGVMLTRALFKRESPVQISIRDSFRLDKSIWRQMFKLGSPVAFERVTLSAGQIVLTAIATGLGTVSLAAHHLAITAEAITYMPAFGFSIAATALVSQCLGAGKKQLAKKYGSLCNWGGIILMTCMGVVLYLGSDFLISIFSPDPDVIALGGAVLRIEAFAQPFFALSMVITGSLRGAGDTKGPFLISLIGMWAVRLPIVFAISTFTTLGLVGVWIAMVADIVVRGLLSWKRFYSKKWLR